jgi:hypothetical protein
LGDFGPINTSQLKESVLLLKDLIKYVKRSDRIPKIIVITNDWCDAIGTTILKCLGAFKNYIGLSIHINSRQIGFNDVNLQNCEFEEIFIWNTANIRFLKDSASLVGWNFDGPSVATGSPNTLR